MRRYGTNEEVAHLLAFLASDASSYCTGSIHMIDGGYVAAYPSGMILQSSLCFRPKLTLAFSIRLSLRRGVSGRSPHAAPRFG